VNTVYAQLAAELGSGAIVGTAKAMGIGSPLRPVPSAVLGTNEVNTLEMASAYGTLAALGRHVAPRAITRVTDGNGDVLLETRPSARQVVAPSVAAETTAILREVIQEGTGVAAAISRPAAGKTGTSEEWRDAWFVGYIPQLVAAVWVGFPGKQVSMVAPAVRLDRVVGGSWPADIWRTFMLKATASMSIEPFPRPGGDQVSVRVDVSRGCLPNRFTPPDLIRLVRFAAGTQPTETCAEPTGLQPVVVPSVVGLPVETAVRSLREAGLQVSRRDELSVSISPGIVIGQWPSAGGRALMGSTVALAVSRSD
jgi:penicillin-binding protein 1A